MQLQQNLTPKLEQLPRQKNDGIFFYLLLLTFFFVLLEVSFFIECNKSYLADFSYVTDHLQIPYAVLPGILFFLGVQFCLHLGYCIFIWIVTELNSSLFRLLPQQKMYMGIGIWLLGIITILLANYSFYPNSKFAELTAMLLGWRQAKWVLILFLISCTSLMVTACVAIAKNKHLRYYLILLPLLLLTIFYPYQRPHAVFNQGVNKNKPNIFIVGVDSLRPDFLSYFGHSAETPFFDDFLTSSTVFSDAVTPLARTFPSWTSILTGLHPHESGIRSNLVRTNDIDFSMSLPTILQRDGYETIYATDETRFSNIDKRYGFDNIVTPPIGLNDFLIGTFNDFPMSNLLVNTRFGRWLFPHSYANRPVFITYEPDSFLHLLEPVLTTKRSNPLFLAIHFCLPHSPYSWAGLPESQYTGVQRYEQSVLRVDQQLHDFFSLLKKNHLLDHAIVVLLSDHGEALELPGDRITEKELYTTAAGRGGVIPSFYPPTLEHEAINVSAGHGTDVLGLPQYHTLLAFRLYGVGKQQAADIPGVVSLLDIKPTVLQLLGHVTKPGLGKSLASYIVGKDRVVPAQFHIFMESDFSPQSIRTVHPEVNKVVLDGIQLFQIDAVTTRLTMKDDMEQKIIDSKQYADIYNGWMLALYPQANRVNIPVLINLETGAWTTDMHSKLALQSPAALMLSRLKAFYKNELGNI